MAFAPFVPLRVLSSYSMLEGAIDPKAIAKLAKERGFPAIAICDRNGLYGTPAFAAACKAEGVQPIVGTLLGDCARRRRRADRLPAALRRRTRPAGRTCATWSAARTSSGRSSSSRTSRSTTSTGAPTG